MTTENPIETRQLGSTGLKVFPMALGCMGMSGMYGAANDNESIATIHAALDAGVTLLDTGDFCGAGHNEMLIGRALKDRRAKALLSVKFGALRSPDSGWGGVQARPVKSEKEIWSLSANGRIERSVHTVNLVGQLTE
jgi:aryl-alcohol dehydrogenase-like predicted oxidoreductase